MATGKLNGSSPVTRSLAEIRSLPQTNPQHQVFSAMRGDGSWNPRLVALSIESFGKCLRVFQAIATGRNSPVEIELDLDAFEWPA
jgi:hypothetical protein